MFSAILDSQFISRVNRYLAIAFAVFLCIGVTRAAGQSRVLKTEDFRRYVDRFNTNDDESVVNQIPNSEAWDWMAKNVPLFECPSGAIEEIYFFRWWSFRKHITQTSDGLVLTEFLRPVSHAGKHNTVSCAASHHLAEARWLFDQTLAEEYTKFWFRSGEGGEPVEHFHKFSSWMPAAIYGHYLVTGDSRLCIELLNDLVQDDKLWVAERGVAGNLFWQFDVRDGMEESISGGRKAKNLRPTINSYMAANALAISRIAKLAGNPVLAEEYQGLYKLRREALLQELWNEEVNFFEVRLESGGFSNVREQIGFIPWMFDLAVEHQSPAWESLQDPQGFWAPAGITTAERRHPEFRTHGVGTCEWDGAVWPFATSQTLTGMANLLRKGHPSPLTRRDFLQHLQTYAESHSMDGAPYIGEYHDEVTGEWLITGPKAERSRYYNHSTFADLVIGGLVGVVPREDTTIEVHPLVPESTWKWFCLDGVHYHGHLLTIIWDQDGKRYGRGAGLQLLVDGREVQRVDKLERLLAPLP